MLTLHGCSANTYRSSHIKCLWSVTSDLSNVDAMAPVGTDPLSLIDSMNMARNMPVGCTMYINRLYKDNRQGEDKLKDPYYYGQAVNIQYKGHISELNTPLFLGPNMDKQLLVPAMMSAARQFEDGVLVDVNSSAALKLFQAYDVDKCSRRLQVIDDEFIIKYESDHWRLVYDPQQVKKINQRATKYVKRARRTGVRQLLCVIASHLDGMVWTDNKVLNQVRYSSDLLCHNDTVHVLSKKVLKIWNLGVAFGMTRRMRRLIENELYELADWWPVLFESHKLDDNFRNWLTEQCRIIKYKLTQPKQKRIKDGTKQCSDSTTDGQPAAVNVDPR